jgi:hypothetical protein
VPLVTAPETVGSVTAFQARLMLVVVLVVAPWLKAGAGGGVTSGVGVLTLLTLKALLAVAELLVAESVALTVMVWVPLLRVVVSQV